MQSTYNPWHDLANRAHITVRWVDKGGRGCINFADRTITLRRSMTYEERRSVVAHELIHDERGAVPRWMEPREERAVRHAASCRLITIDHLAHVLSWTTFPAEAAAELGVDAPTLQARLINLTDGERTRLSAALTNVPHVGHNESNEGD